MIVLHSPDRPGDFRCYIGSTVDYSRRISAHGRAPPAGILRWARARNLATWDDDRQKWHFDIRVSASFAPVAVAPTPQLRSVETWWTRHLAAADGRGLNSFGIRGNPSSNLRWRFSRVASRARAAALALPRSAGLAGQSRRPPSSRRLG